MRKTVFLRTFGCQMNDRDSEIVAGMLARQGYALVEKPEEADVVLFNTCSVREHAEDRVWGQAAALKKSKIGVIGCMAKIHGEDIFKKLPHVSFICSPANIYDVPDLVERARKGERGISSIDKEVRPLGCAGENARNDKMTTYVNIIEGCNNFCSYCVVPYARGRERSRPAEDILGEIKELINSGVSDITLLGQNVNAYQSGGIDFVRLISLVNAAPGLGQFSFVTSHPKDASREMFQAMQAADKLKKYLHLPAQSGSDRILELMNRKYTRKTYLGLVEDYRKIVKDGALSTDIIVGFPTETQKDFQDTYDLLKEVEFDSAFIFKYSPRPRTAAAKMPDDVPKQEKEKRHASILALQKKISIEKKNSLSPRSGK